MIWFNIVKHLDMWLKFLVSIGMVDFVWILSTLKKLELNTCKNKYSGLPNLKKKSLKYD